MLKLCKDPVLYLTDDPVPSLENSMLLLALVGHPSSDGAAIKILYGVGISLARFAPHLLG